jgi:hypothetical protein
MRSKYFLSRNPFPSGAILSEGSTEPSESGEIFNAEAAAEAVKEYVLKFVFQPALTKGSGFGALWSLGSGRGEARGYGKSSMGNYVSRRINVDFGKSILSEYSPKDVPLNTSILASYASFKKDVVTGFHAIAFRHTEWLTEPQPGWYDDPPLKRLRDLIASSFEPTAGSSALQQTNAIVDKINRLREKLRGQKLGPLDDELLNALADPNPLVARRFLEGISTWKRMRNGFSFFDTALSFAMGAGIQKAILFTDQVEDFASPDVPRNKRLKEVERFRDIVNETVPFNSIVYYILTMHPRARDAIADIWKDARLPNIDPPGWFGGRPENVVRVQVLKGINNKNEALSLFRSYLNHPEYRLPGAQNPLHPFASEAIWSITRKNGGRPGFMLQDAHDILELSAFENRDLITPDIVQRTPSKIPTDEGSPEQPEERGLPPELQK